MRKRSYCELPLLGHHFHRPVFVVAQVTARPQVFVFDAFSFVYTSPLVPAARQAVYPVQHAEVSYGDGGV